MILPFNNCVECSSISLRLHSLQFTKILRCQFIRLLLGLPIHVFNNRNQGLSGGPSSRGSVLSLGKNCQSRTQLPLSPHPQTPITATTRVTQGFGLELFSGSTLVQDLKSHLVGQTYVMWLPLDSTEGSERKYQVFSSFQTRNWQDEGSLGNSSSFDPTHSTESSLEENQILGKDHWAVEGQVLCSLEHICTLTYSTDWYLGCFQNFTVKIMLRIFVYVPFCSHLSISMRDN